MPIFATLWATVMVAAYGILFGIASILSRLPSPRSALFSWANGLLYLLSFGSGAFWALTNLGNLLEILAVILGGYILAVLLVSPSLYLMARRRRPVGSFGPFVAIIVGAKLIQSLPFFLSAFGYIGTITLWDVRGALATTAVAMAFALLVSALFPHLVALVGKRSESLTRAAVPLALKAHMKPPTVVLLPARAAAIPNAFVMGPFNRYVFVTDDLYERSGTDATLATIAHELGHRSRRHIPRMLIILVLWALLASIPWGGSPWVLVLFPIVLFALMRHGEHDADLFGARLVGTEAMVQNLTTLQELAGLPPETRRRRSFSLFATHPTIQRRVDRLLRAAHLKRPGSPPD